MLTHLLLALVPLAPAAKYPDLPTAVSSFGAAVVGDHVYVYGGHAGKAHSYSTETTCGEFRRLILKQPTKWEELPAGPKLQGLALVAHNGKVIRVGGMQPQNSKTEKTDIRSQTGVASFDPATGRWTDLPALPDPRSSHDAVVVGDTLYVFGGWTLTGNNKGTWLDHGLLLDLSSPGAKWEKVKQPFQRRALTTAVYDGKVYVVGGLKSDGISKGVDVFDPKSGEWATGPELPGEGMNGFTPASASAADGGRLYLTPRDGTMLRLSDTKDRWEEIGKLAQARFVARMVAGPDKTLVVIAGASPGGMLASVESIPLR